MQPVYDNHLGWVINTNDPEGRQRVQVFIPYLSNTLYSNWNKELKNINFKNPLELGDGILSSLRQSLPWAECAMPIFGSATAMKANPSSGRITVNGGSSLPTVQPEENPNNLAPLPQDTDNIYDNIEQPPDPDILENEEDDIQLPTTPDTYYDTLPDGSLVLKDSSGKIVSYGEQGVEPVSPINIADNNPEEYAPLLADPQATITADPAFRPSEENFSGNNGGQITEIPGADRRLPLSSGLKSAISTALAGTGVNWKSTSGGQWPAGVIDPSTGRQGSRVGTTTNHDWGNATDGQFIDIKTGNPIDATTPVGQAKIASLLPRLRQAGIKGVGWDDVGYMGPTKWHLDIVNPNVWGAEGKSANAAPWVEAALDGVPQGQITAANQISDESIAMQPDVIGFQGSRPDITLGGNGSPNGIFAVPAIGAKVWVFFYGGDVQKPVYFAAAVEPSAARTI